MRFKLDENLPAETADLFKRTGHDAVTVLEEQLGATSELATSQGHGSAPTGKARVSRLLIHAHPCQVVLKLS